MKKVFIPLIVGLMGLSLNAQKVIEKNLDHKGQAIEVDVKFASDIQVLTWDRPTVYFKAEITTKDGKFLDLYQLNVEQNDKTIKIAPEVNELFKAIHMEREGKDSDRGVHLMDGDYEFHYVLQVPKNSKFKIGSINGNLKAELIEGDFTAELINGDIEIEEYSGDMDLRTINGEIDLVMRDTKLEAETIHGSIYVDDTLELKVIDRIVGQKVEGSFDRATHRLKLNTINGNLYLRKEGR